MGSTPTVGTMYNCDCYHLTIAIQRVLGKSSPIRWRLHDLDDHYLLFYCSDCGERAPLPATWEYHPLAWQYRSETYGGWGVVIPTPGL